MLIPSHYQQKRQRKTRCRLITKGEAFNIMTWLKKLVVFGIPLLVSVALVCAYFGYTSDESKKAKTIRSLKIICDELHRFKKLCKDFPTQAQGIERLTKMDQNTCPAFFPQPFFKKLPRDFWGNEFVYVPAEGTFTLESLGSDGKKGGEEFAADITSSEYCTPPKN